MVLLSALPLAFGLLGLVQPWHDEWFVNESFHYPGAFLFAGGVTLLMSGLLNRVKLTEAGFALHNGSGHKHVLRREHVAEIWHVDWKPSPVYVRDHWGRVFTVGTAAYDVEYARYLVQVMRAHWRANLPEMPPARPTTHPGSVPSMRPVSHPGSAPSMRPVGHPASVPSMRPVAHPASVPSMRPVSHPASMPSMRPVTHPGSHPAMRPADQAPAPEGRAAGSAAPPAQPTT
ncbi:Mucin [Actinosynnema pretiosum subsp. pretiosum]|nr:Mucin [Actinosynnema pretiosum subsp. pretiosum]